MIDNLSMTFRQNSQRTNAAKKEKAFGQRNPAKRTARGVAASKAYYVFGCLKRMGFYLECFCRYSPGVTEANFLNTREK